MNEHRVRQLTSREMQVAQLVGCGFSNIEITDHLRISVNTVKRHLSNSMLKLDAVNRAEVVRLVDHSDQSKLNP